MSGFEYCARIHVDYFFHFDDIADFQLRSECPDQPGGEKDARRIAPNQYFGCVSGGVSADATHRNYCVVELEEFHSFC